MNVLSLFDGISVGQIALNNVGIVPDAYFSSEVDQYAISITQKNFPKTIQLGDISNIKGTQLPQIDLLIGGPPCQGFSMAGKRLNFNDPRSKLFYQYARLLQETKPKFFLMENVLMKEEWEIQISNELGVYPVKINSSLVSAQNRRRNYWANFPISQPDDRKIFWKDIQLDDATDVYYMTEKMMTWIWEDPKRRDRFKIYDKDTKEKMQMLEASHYKGISNQRCFSIQDKGLRYIHPIECERLQNIPDDYTAGVSRTQRYKMLGNSWTTGVVSHIFKGLLCSS